ncbi:hypothetical protein [Subtercola vilae]|nr:hypothetical protein [Subtercola vilae]
MAAASSTVWSAMPGLIEAGAALSQMPRYGAPQRHGTRHGSGLRGRRDACLIVLVGVLQLSRREARQISTTDVRIDTTLTGSIIRIGDLVVPRTDTPGSCPSCAITRWLRVTNAISIGHRGTALDLIDVTRKDETSHDCDRPFSIDMPGGEGAIAGLLLLSLTHEGWTQPGVALSTRSISKIVHARRIPTGHREEPTYRRPSPAGRFAMATAEQVYRAAGDVDDEADHLLRRSQRLLALIEKTVTLGDAAERR